MKFTEYAAHDAVGLAELVRKREVSPLEVVDAAIEGIEQYDREINAVVYRAFDEARAAAAGQLPSGPFTGVPSASEPLRPSRAEGRTNQILVSLTVPLGAF